MSARQEYRDYLEANEKVIEALREAVAHIETHGLYDKDCRDCVRVTVAITDATAAARRP